MRWHGLEKGFEFLEHVGHGSESHGLGPYNLNDLVEDHGSSFEEFVNDVVVVIEYGSAR